MQQMHWLTHTWTRVGYGTTRVCVNVVIPLPPADSIPLNLNLRAITRSVMPSRMNSHLYKKSKVNYWLQKWCTQFVNSGKRWCEMYYNKMHEIWTPLCVYQ